MSQPQPLPVDRRTAPPLTAAGEFSRLLNLWIDLAARAAAAVGHDSSDAASIIRLHLDIEDVLEARFPEEFSRIRDELIGWEASLLHASDPAEVSTSCLHCRRARVGLPENLPLPARGGRK